MAKSPWLIFLGVLAGIAAAAAPRTVYIVHMRDGTSRNALHRRATFQDSLQSANANPDSIIYTYTHTINGYAAPLTARQADALRAQPNVLSVEAQRVYRLHTTRTPRFLGLDDITPPAQVQPTNLGSHLDGRGLGGDAATAAAEADVIIGMLDTGVWPEHPSFADDGLPPVPSRWKGVCEAGDQFAATACNKKLIGARYFSAGFIASGDSNGSFAGLIKSPRDSEGHGTHTSATAAGVPVQNANLFGHLAAGTARGVAKNARIATYKVCWRNNCYQADMLAAMDQAIADGVDIISMSIGAPPIFNASESMIVGSISAMEKGIFFAQSAGNGGPDPWTVSNVSPWVMTVAASTLDRDFPAAVTLGNGKKYAGASLYTDGSVPDVKPWSDKEVLPLIYGGDASTGNATAGSLCIAGSLDSAKVAGKVVLCLRGENFRVVKGDTVKKAGGRGVIVANKFPNETIVADAHLLPGLSLGSQDGAAVLDYAKTAGASVSMHFGGTRIGNPAPFMATFSSRGPNSMVPGLLKPDITGPGVNILAAWPTNRGPSETEPDNRNVTFNIISGTSMSTPHIAGIAALIKARRPEWSPAAIRSALMTTAYTTLKGGSNSSSIGDNFDGSNATPFAYGSGHVEAVAALDPGLVYDIAPAEYRDFLCAVNSTAEFITGITRSNFTCDPKKTYSVNDLNYPSFSAVYDPASSATAAAKGPIKTKFRRTVTNVGAGAATYRAAVTLADPGLAKVSVEPQTLTFGAKGDKRSFEVTVTLPPRANGTLSHGRLVWSDGTHTVGSALAFVWPPKES